MNLKSKTTEQLLDMMVLVTVRARSDMIRAVDLNGVRISNINHFREHIRGSGDILLKQALETLNEIGTELNERRI